MIALDASALLAFLFREKGAETVGAHLADSPPDGARPKGGAVYRERSGRGRDYPCGSRSMAVISEGSSTRSMAFRLSRMLAGLLAPGIGRM